MALLAGDVYEVAVNQTFENQQLVNVLHFKCLRNISAAQTAFQTLADDIKEMMRPEQSNGVTYTGWKAFQVAGDGITYNASNCRRSGGDVYEGLNTGTLIGGRSTTASDASTLAMVVALKTGLAGRSRRGSFYVGGYLVGDHTTNPNRFEAARVTAMQTAITAFLVKYGVPLGTSLDFGWVVFSRFIASGCKYVNQANAKPKLLNVQAGNQALAKADVKSGTPRALIAFMRRRKEGRGV